MWWIWVEPQSAVDGCQVPGMVWPSGHRSPLLMELRSVAGIACGFGRA